MNMPHEPHPVLPEDPLDALSPLDGRYREAASPLRAYFSESALMRERVYVEVVYLIALLDELDLSPRTDLRAQLLGIAQNFSRADALEIKRLERETRHDVKAVEYFLRGRLTAVAGLAQHIERVHLGLTSEDVNNLAYARLLAGARARVMVPATVTVIQKLVDLASATADLPMLARTHGQPATPTTLGKEMAVFLHRLVNATQNVLTVPIAGKLAGATGTYGAHEVAFPGHDWADFARHMIGEMGLEPRAFVTQSESHDDLASLCDAYTRQASVALDLCQDLWRYISDGWFGLETISSEVGSSAMPHKVNPIDFENAEGNFGLARALFTHFSSKLPISRLQRDLSDSTVMRNLGVAHGHMLLGLDSLAKGLGKLAPNTERLLADLAAHPEVLAEAYQVALRAEGHVAPYETLKALTRGTHVTLGDLHAFLDTVDAPEPMLNRLHALTPESYIGQAPSLARQAIKEAEGWLSVQVPARAQVR
jgi:adenylosuccinate lyase